MNIRLETKVKGNYLKVMDQFDRDLFEALEPEIGEMEIVEFTGSKTGDRVHLRFLKPFKAEWISEIIDHGEDEEIAFFVDEGVKMPFGISYWRHKHMVEKINEDTSLIIDNINFRGKNRWHTYLLYPVIFLAFYPRKKVYKKYFGAA